MRKCALSQPFVYLHILYRFMKTPERLASLRQARETLRKRDRKITQLKKKLELLTSQGGVAIAGDAHEEIMQGIEVGNREVACLPVSDFRRVFWEQQVCFMY